MERFFKKGIFMPFHPGLVHLPIALSFILPFLTLVFIFFINKKWADPKVWLVVIGLNLLLTGAGYLSLETGETEEDRVEKIVEQKFIHEHEEAAEIFVGSSVIVLCLSIVAFFINEKFQTKMRLFVFGLSLISGVLSFRTGHLGGELVYKHGAAKAYSAPTSFKEISDDQSGIEEESSEEFTEDDSRQED